ncbi:MAG: TraR/DksA C4-type zinc finger protein [Acidimicrobiales bacterium]|jgi:RNA polymerase-binding transcription factor DksA|nr:TraR/DksA C4-type zinc finger protein [Acidimicrobiales bacterium]
MSEHGVNTGRPDRPAGDLAATRALLDQTREQLEAQVHELGLEGDAAVVDENFADSAAVSAEQGELQALAAGLREQLDDVEVALTRLDDGTYGTCVVCGTDIGAARLEAMPATRYCIDHAG